MLRTLAQSSGRSKMATATTESPPKSSAHAGSTTRLVFTMVVEGVAGVDPLEEGIGLCPLEGHDAYVVDNQDEN